MSISTSDTEQRTNIVVDKCFLKGIIQISGFQLRQKALASVETTRKMLSLPVNYSVEEIRSGCCGMAGAFGYEKEHYKVSMQVGELVLFPEIRKTSSEFIIAAPGTSCRQQIIDGTGRQAHHPMEIIFDALLPGSVSPLR